MKDYFKKVDGDTHHRAIEVRVAKPCAHDHMRLVPAVMQPGGGCQACLSMEPRGEWLHLRKCLTCGFVGCCDFSPNRHITQHNHGTGHPLVASAEPGEHWVFCYEDDQMVQT